MRWFINDSSLRGQFTGRRDEFLKILREIVSFRNQFSEFKGNCYISSEIGTKPVDAEFNLVQVLNQVIEPSDAEIRVFIRSFLNWFARTGPFILEAMADRFDGIIEFRGENVSATAVGVAATSKIHGTETILFSFSGGGEEFEANSIIVEHKFGLSTNQVEICNICRVVELKSSIEAVQPEETITKWIDLIPFLKSKFLNLEFDSTDADSMKDLPFAGYILEKIIERCEILNEYVENLNNGRENDRANEIKRNFFQGERAWFSDESETNKNKFKKEMTFQSARGG